MSVECINGTTNTNNYYVHPKKTSTNRILMTGGGLATSGAIIGYLLQEPENYIRNGKSVKSLFEGKFNLEKVLRECSTGIDFIDKRITGRKSMIITKYLPVAGVSLAFILGCFGIGAALDSFKHNRKIKKAQKQALKMQEKALEIQMKENLLKQNNTINTLA